MKITDNRKSAAKQIYGFAPIPGFEERYLISKDGRVYSLVSNKILKPANHKGDDYLQVSLSDGSKNYTFKIHRLVAMTYVENPNKLPEVNHIDFNRLNNYFENLEWCSHYDNVKHSRDAGNYPQYNTSRKAYVFTNVHNGNSFAVIGWRNMLKQFGMKPGNASVITRNAGTGKYIGKGLLKGLKIDIIDLDVRRSV